MKYSIKLIGWIDISYAALLFLDKRAHYYNYLSLLSAITCTATAFFFYHLKDEMKNFELKNSAVNDPKILDQI